MGNWNKRKLKTWAKVRQAGRRRYILNMILMSAGSVLLGKTIGFILFDRVQTWAEFWYEFSLSAIVLLALSVVIGFVSWHISESWYVRELRKSERT